MRLFCASVENTRRELWALTGLIEIMGGQHSCQELALRFFP